MPEHEEESDHCFNRAFYEAAQYMRKAGNPGGRRVIIVITGITKSINCSGPTSEEVSMALLESGSVVCALVPNTAEQRVEDRLMTGIATTAGIFRAHTLSLKQVTEETGGEIFNSKPENMDMAFNDLIDHLRTRYSLGFSSSNTKNDGSFRKLKLEVSSSIEKREGKLVIKARRGYVASKTPTD
jgi:VWFA-related protein